MDLPAEQIITGQSTAESALRYGLTVAGDDQHLYVRGMPGVGRMTLLQQMIRSNGGYCQTPKDKCYLHNFDEPSKPLLLELDPGSAPQLKSLMQRFVRFVAEDLSHVLKSDAITARKDHIDRASRKALEQLSAPFEAELQAHNLAILTIEAAGAIQPTIVPIIDGKPVSHEEFEQLKSSGSISPEAAETIARQIDQFTENFSVLGAEIQKLQIEYRDKVRVLFQEEARRATTVRLKAIGKLHNSETLQQFLKNVENDLVQVQLGSLETSNFSRRYDINVVSTHVPGSPPQIVFERNPIIKQLFGNIDAHFTKKGPGPSDHLSIQPGSIVKADGGYLLIDAKDLFEEPGAWQLLTRALRANSIDFSWLNQQSFVHNNELIPEPLPVNMKIILVGSHALHYFLENQDPHFQDLFKVLVDFESTTQKTEENANYFANAIATIVRSHNLKPLTRDGVASLLEHSVRVAGDRGRFSLRFRRMLDLVREADWIAARRNAELIEGIDIAASIEAGRSRAELPIQRFRRNIQTRVIQISVADNVVGQVNGLATSQSGPLTYGFPARITATVGAGSDGTISIDREADLSGNIHTKGFHILGGLLRHLLRVAHPLTFTASLSFEQSYGGIDGDSASCAEISALLSALTDVPIRQDLAITGAIDQKGNVLPIGGVSEKIEGFFFTCTDLGLTGTQGVIIPQTNIADLCLRTEVINAVEAGQFHIYAVQNVYQALARLTGMVVAERTEHGYGEGSFLDLAERRVSEIWSLIGRLKA